MPTNLYKLFSAAETIGGAFLLAGIFWLFFVLPGPARTFVPFQIDSPPTNQTENSTAKQITNQILNSKGSRENLNRKFRFQSFCDLEERLRFG